MGTSSCPVCGRHVRDGACPTCGPVSKDEVKIKARRRKGGLGKTIPKDGKK